MSGTRILSDQENLLMDVVRRAVDGMHYSVASFGVGETERR